MFRSLLLGPAYFRHRWLIAESRSWSPGDIAEYQAQAMRPLRRRYGQFTTTTKADYRANPGHYAPFAPPLLTRTVHTGGSTGQPLTFTADTFARRQKERAYLHDIWSAAGYEPHDLRVVFRGTPHRGRMITRDRLENAWIVSPAVTKAQVPELRGFLASLPPFFLHVYPGSLRPFIELAGGDGAFRRLPVRGVLAGSESFLPGQQRRFEQEFGIHIAHWYGHSEYAVVARYCGECDGLHFYPTYGTAELRPGGEGGLLRIVATSANRLGTQFWRYETGDLALPAPGTCGTDRWLRSGLIAGRQQEVFTDAEGTVRALNPFLYGNHHDGFWEMVDDVRLSQPAAGVLRVTLVTSSARASRHRIEQLLSDRFPMVALEFEYTAQIHRGVNKRTFLTNGGDSDRRQGDSRPRSVHPH